MDHDPVEDCKCSALRLWKDGKDENWHRRTHPYTCLRTYTAGSIRMVTTGASGGLRRPLHKIPMIEIRYHFVNHSCLSKSSSHFAAVGREVSTSPHVRARSVGVEQGVNYETDSKYGHFIALAFIP